MGLREIKPGIVIRCANEDDYKRLNEETIKKGFGELPCSGANRYDDKCFYISADGIGWSYLTDDGEIPRGKVADLCELIIEVDEYNRGLNDAWAILKKLMLPAEDGGISLPDMYHIFGTSNFCEILCDWDVKDVIAKMEVYEKEQSEIKVGDVVSHDGLKGVVTRVADDCIYTISFIGTTPRYSATESKKLIKTGKHIDISALLAEIGKE